MIVVFGSINLDIFFRCGRLPASGETLLCESAETAPGGKGANQALAAARDGARVVMAGAVGQDLFADQALALLATEAVDLRAVRRTGSLTGCATIAIAENGENAIIVGSGANLEAAASSVPDAVLEPGNWLLLQMEIPYRENWALLERARQRGTRIMLNLAPFGPVPRGLLEKVDLLVLNEVEADQLAASEDGKGTSSSMADLAAKCGGTVIMTLGADGLSIFQPNGEELGVPAFEIQPVDTTGAGDCFCGVLAAGLDRGLPLTHAAKRASAAAAIACTRAGAQTSLPTSLEIDAQLSHLETRPLRG